MVKKCARCRERVYYIGLCKSHFIESIDKRFKKELDLKKGAAYLVKDKVIEFMLQRNIKMPIKIVKKGDYPEINGFTAEYFVDYCLSNLFKGKIISFPKGIYPLQNITYDELSHYLSALEIKMQLKKPRSEILSLIKPLGKEVIHGIVKSMKNL